MPTMSISVMLKSARRRVLFNMTIRPRTKRDDDRKKKKIDILREELILVVSQLAGKKEVFDRLTSEIGAAEKNIGELRQQKENIEAKIASLGEDLNKKELEYGKQLKPRLEAISRLDRAIKDKNDKINELNKELDKLLAIKGEIKESEKKLVEMKKSAAGVVDGVLNETVALWKIRKVTERVIERLRAKETDVNEKIARNGKLLTQTEKNLRTIEHYAKRLQRMYDKAGIRIDVLGQFGVKRDSITLNKNGIK